MISNNLNKDDRIVELLPEKKSEYKKRRMAAAVLSVICTAAICVSVGTASEKASDKDSANLSEYSCSENETGGEENDGYSSDVGAENTSNPAIPDVTVPKAAPRSVSVMESAVINPGRSLESSPLLRDVTVISMNGTDYIEASGTVEDALIKAGVDTDKNDIVTPSLETSLTDRLIITVKDVKFYKVTKNESIPFETTYVDDETLPEGETEIVAYGREGTKKTVYKIKKIDGEETERELISEEVIEEPVNQITANGTMIPASENYEGNAADSTDENYGVYGCSYDNADELREDSEESAADAYSEEAFYTEDGISASSVPAISQFDVPANIILDENNVPINYVRTVHGKACAYTAEPGALMSTGKEVFQGYVAVNPEIIPYGSKLYIVADDGEVYGYAIAADTGGSVMKGSIVVDLFMWSYDDCIEWGNKNVTIYIIEEGE